MISADENGGMVAGSKRGKSIATRKLPATSIVKIAACKLNQISSDVNSSRMQLNVLVRFFYANVTYPMCNLGRRVTRYFSKIKRTLLLRHLNLLTLR